MKTLISLMLFASAAFAQSPSMGVQLVWGNPAKVLPQYAPRDPGTILYASADVSALPNVKSLLFVVTCDDNYTDSRIGTVQKYAQSTVAFNIDKDYALAQRCRVTVTAASVTSVAVTE